MRTKLLLLLAAALAGCSTMPKADADHVGRSAGAVSVIALPAFGF